ncbi:cytochrome c oxidase subunit 4 [Allobranchiibius sp. GilTou73]|uniref:aa3-type cytochrome oxidase subunit IV n=1 Tax=Allobranchiibius sp. GilTou73 TaxID=2904523 RepID=UPI001F1A282E|nr:cytochrome c oxidase subunit 4 [Allobranchiibius sp. GilTou73]UIJ33748.1 cytochrome c oxidase subunit 4 [Allobranchiibius sp. GilTou73]
MKVGYRIFGILCVFFAVVGVICGIFTTFHEPVGFTALLLSSGLTLLALWAIERVFEHLRPEGAI